MEKIYFRKFWKEIKFEETYKDTVYYIETYPLDIYDCDTIVIRVYLDKEMTDECGNGIWLDSDFGIIDGNDELYFGHEPLQDTEIETFILEKVYKKLKDSKIIY